MEEGGIIAPVSARLDDETSEHMHTELHVLDMQRTLEGWVS